MAKAIPKIPVPDVEQSQPKLGDLAQGIDPVYLDVGAVAHDVILSQLKILASPQALDLHQSLEQLRKKIAVPVSAIFDIGQSMQRISEMASKTIQNVALSSLGSVAALNNILHAQNIPAFDLARISALPIVQSDSLHNVFAQSLTFDNTASIASLGLSVTRINEQFRSLHGLLNQKWLADIIGPVNATAELFQSTQLRLKSTGNARIEQVLKGSLLLTESQLIATTDIVCSLTDEPEDNGSIPGSPGLNLAEMQQEELLAISDESGESDILVLTEGSMSTRGALIGRDIITLIVQCNEQAKLQGMDEVFKPTTKLLSAASQLPWITPIDTRSFGDVIDSLYFLLYEGAGKDSLRFMQKNGGPMEDSDCEVIFRIKHLRNKWLRHDPDHGQQSDIKRSWKQLKEVFEWLGLGRIPLNRSEYQQLHVRLLDKVYKFLYQLLLNLSKTQN